METFVNLAYGSNLHPVRLRRRCPSARVVRTTRLGGWQLAFRKRGRDGSAKCDAVPTGRPEHHLWVAVYEIPVAEKPALDAAEDLGRGYREHRVEGAGTLYRARREAVDAALPPFDWYHAMVLAGARFHGFPAPYLESIGAVAAVGDPRPARAAGNWSVVRQMMRAGGVPE